MGLFKTFFLNFNSFQSQQFFRFNGDYEYTNVMGGVFTLIIRVLLLVLLLTKLVDVFKRNTVISSTTTSFQLDETVKIPVSPSNQNSPFLLVIEVVKYSSSLSQSEFENKLVSWTLNSSSGFTILQKCTPEHWSTVPTSFYNQILSSVS